MSALLITIVALPALAALVCVVAPPRSAEGAGRLGAAAATCSFGLAVALLVSVIASGPVSAVLADGTGRATVGLFADRLACVMLLLVLGVSAVVQLFASRYLSGDPRQRRLIGAAGLTTAAAAGVVPAATLSVLVVAWLVTGAGLLLMLAQRGHLASARLGVRRAATAFAVGDLALVLAGLVVWMTVGDLDLRQIGDEAGGLAAQELSDWA